MIDGPMLEQAQRILGAASLADCVQTLVFTHGLGQSAAAWDGHVAQLGRRFDVRTWDLPGHGARAAEGGEYADAEGAVAELAALARDAPGPPVLVGHSAGGYLTLRYALGLAPSAQSVVRGLVLINTGPGFRNPERMQEWNRQMDKVARALSLPPEAARIVHMSDSLVIDRLGQATMPALVIVGGADRPAYRAGARYLAEHLPHAELLEIADAGHDPHLTHADQVSAAIADFAGAI